MKQSVLTGPSTEFRGSLNDPILERIGLREYSIVIVGVLLSILFYEVSGLSPEGLIVPGYFALL